MIPAIARKLSGLFHRAEALFNRLKVQDQCVIGKNVKILLKGTVNNPHGHRTNITIGKDSILCGELGTFSCHAKITVGESTHIGPNTNIMAYESISIGSRVEISYNVNIYDNNSHPISALQRFEHVQNIISSGHPPLVPGLVSAPIFIDDDVWIGFGSTILKGVKIGKGAIIGACTVITKDIPPYSIVIGNPQKIIGASSK